MSGLDDRPYGACATDRTELSIFRFQQSLFGEHHRQRNAAEPGPGVIQKSATIEKVVAGEEVDMLHEVKSAEQECSRSFLPERTTRLVASSNQSRSNKSQHGNVERPYGPPTFASRQESFPAEKDRLCYSINKNSLLFSTARQNAEMP